MLISAQSLMEIYGEEQTRILDCRYVLSDPTAGIGSYRQGHIPGSIYLDLSENLSSPIRAGTGRHPLPAADSFAEAIGKWGVADDSTVIAYDDGPGSMAARCWWLLRWFGHQSVYVLDGGLDAWVEQGGPLFDEVGAYPPAQFTGRPQQNHWIDADTLMRAIDDPDQLIIDARENKRFLGLEEPIDRIAGHMPSAINRPFQHNLWGGCFKSAKSLRQEFVELIGDAPPSQVIHSCGSGVTACHNLLAMEVAGLSGSRLYPGSWSEWITDPSRPIISMM